MMAHSSNRRDFLASFKGNPDIAAETVCPTGGDTIRLSTRAMACEFSVILNPGDRSDLQPAGEVLELIHGIESWLSVYRNTSLISQVNVQASSEPVHVQRSLFDLLQTAVELHRQTNGAFDVTSGALINLWRVCRGEQRIPEQHEIDRAMAACGSQHLRLDESRSSIQFAVDGLQLDPGAIGKGYALDKAREWLRSVEVSPESFLLHGGHSSLIARGSHNDLAGWPVGIGNPLLTQKRLGTVLLRDQAMSTSGSNIQFFRHEGQRYGHILDPTTGWPVEGMLSVTVLADSAAVADALSTAFFVLGVENALKCCDNLTNVGAILIPFPEAGKRVTPITKGVPPERIFWDQEQVVTI